MPSITTLDIACICAGCFVFSLYIAHDTSSSEGRIFQGFFFFFFFEIQVLLVLEPVYFPEKASAMSGSVYQILI